MLVKKPVIAAISGYAVAGGFELACWCDLRVVDQSAILGIYCRMRGMILSVEELISGVPLIDGGTIRLPRLIGLSRAMDIILTGYILPKYLTVVVMFRRKNVWKSVWQTTWHLLQKQHSPKLSR
jgi:enoyl-CoA hydratase/carnithine racemase